MTQAAVQGFCDARFVALQQQFAQLISGFDQAGAAVAVFHRGHCVANLWGGFIDRARSRPWQQDTAVNIFSAGKGVMALATLLLVARGQIRLDDTVCSVWPQFAAHGKEQITLRHVLTHRSGLPAFRQAVADEAIYEFDAMVRYIEHETPHWPAGEKQAYHAFTYGWILGEIIRRITGKMPGQFIEDEFARELAAPLYIGVPDQNLGQIADIEPLPQPLPGAAGLMALLGAGDSSRFALTQSVFMNPPSLMSGSNRRAWRQAQIPAANAHASALALAGLYNLSLIDTERWPVELMQQAAREQSNAIDEVLLAPVRFGLGFMLQRKPNGPVYSARRHAGFHAYGHPGAGGSIAFADPEHDIAFAYVTRGMGSSTFGDVRSRQLIEALNSAISTIEGDEHE